MAGNLQASPCTVVGVNDGKSELFDNFIDLGGFVAKLWNMEGLKGFELSNVSKLKYHSKGVVRPKTTQEPRR